MNIVASTNEGKGICTIFKTRLQVRIASGYLKAGQLPMARVYVDRGLDGITLYDGSLQDPEVETLDVYAEVLTVVSKISFIHGEVERTVDKLYHAVQFNTLDNANRARLKQYEDREKQSIRKRDRRRDTQRIECEKAHDKIIGIVDFLSESG